MVLPVDPGEARDRHIASRHVDEKPGRRYRELKMRVEGVHPHTGRDRYGIADDLLLRWIETSGEDPT